MRESGVAPTFDVGGRRNACAEAGADSDRWENVTMKNLLNSLRAWCLAAALAALLPVPAHAQVALDWADATPQHYGDMLALDKDNNVYVAGSDPLGLTMVVSKYGPEGTKPVWQKKFDATNAGTYEQSSWITVDAAGNVIVVGSIVRASDFSTHGTVVLKYDPAGNLLWSEVRSAPYAYTLRVATDADSNVYVLGRAWLTNASGNTTLDIVTTKYDGRSGARAWTRALQFDNFSADTPSSLAVTPTGNVIVAGGRVAAAYDGNGNLQWSHVFETRTAALDVGVAANGDFYIVGGTYSTATGNVFLVHRFDAGFNLLWRRTYGVGPWGWRVAVDPLGNAIVTGIAAAGYTDWMTIKVAPSGTLLWSRRYDQHAHNDEIPYAITTGPDASIYVTGQGGPGPTAGSLSDLRTVTVKYAPDGTPAWSATTFDAVRGVAVKLATDGGVFVLGESPHTVFHYHQTGASNQLPTAVASANLTFGTAPLAVTFSSAGTGDPDGAITRYEWDFGDGTRSNAASPTHTYAAGTWTATLTVTDNMGATATSPQLVIKAVAPPATPIGISFSSPSVVGGKSVTATVNVSSTSGVVVALSSSDSSIATVPATVTVPVGATRASFTVRTSRVRADTAVTIWATANDVTAGATLTVRRR